MKRASALLLAAGLSACAWLRAPPVGAGDTALNELSGLARSPGGGEGLWAHNDSGDTARLFRLAADGSPQGEVALTGAANTDWEDIAAFHWQGQPALLVGDIGDNVGWREQLQLYALAEPAATATAAPLLWTLRVRYPDGPRDAEGLAVDSRDGRILILSKRERPPRLYSLPLPTADPGDAVHTLRADGPVLGIAPATALDIADDPVFGLLRDWPTALDVAPDGSFAVVTTYKDAWRYRRAPGESWATAMARTPERVDIPQFRQTEAGAITADGRTLVVGSERRAGFARVPLPP